MENTTWEQRHKALTHILTIPTTSPSLSSQFFISSQIPCYLDWDFPPIFCPHNPKKSILSPHLKWGISLFLKRIFTLGFPPTSWRSKCPYHQPPPLVLAKGVAPAKWAAEEKREYVRRRLRRGRLVNNVNPWVPILVPNLMLFSLLLWNPFPDLVDN